MNRTMKRISTQIATTLLLLFIPVWMTTLLAQTEEQIEKFKQEMRSYYNEKLQLTAQEKDKFWPIYDDFYNRKIKLDENERLTYRYCHSNVENMSQEEIAEALDKIMELKEQKHSLEKEYHEKFLNILPPKKVLMLYKVERDFRMHLIRQIRKRGRGDDNRRGGSRGPAPYDQPGTGMDPGKGFDHGTSMDMHPGKGFDHGKGSGSLKGFDHGTSMNPGKGFDHGKGSGSLKGFDHGTSMGSGPQIRPQGPPVISSERSL